MTTGANTEIDFATRLSNLEAAVFGGPNPLGGGAQEQQAVQVAAGSTDAITLRSGLVVVSATGVDALTLANPIPGAASVGGNDGCVLTVYSLGAHAHTVTTGTNGINGADHVATFTAAALNYVTLKAYNGSWYVQGSLNVSLS